MSFEDKDYCPDCNKHTWEVKYIEELDEEIIFPVECDCKKVLWAIDPEGIDFK